MMCSVYLSIMSTLNVVVVVQSNGLMQGCAYVVEVLSIKIFNFGVQTPNPRNSMVYVKENLDGTPNDNVTLGL